MNLQGQSQSLECRFLEAKANEWDLFGDRRIAFLTRFDQSNRTTKLHILAEQIKWNKDLKQTGCTESSRGGTTYANPTQKLLDELNQIYTQLEKLKIEGFPLKERKKGRPPEGEGKWELIMQWLWNTEFRKWQQQLDCQEKADPLKEEQLGPSATNKKWDLVEDILSQLVRGRNLKNIDLSDANLIEAYLSGAILSGTILSSADLRHADLSSADLRHADLSSANLRHASLSRADLRHADLSSANLRHASLSSADLRHADLSRADLRGADLRRADLRRADVDRSDDNLHDTDLSGADLRRANLTGVFLNDANVRDALLGSNRGLSKTMRHELELGGAIFKVNFAWQIVNQIVNIMLFVVSAVVVVCSLPIRWIASQNVRKILWFVVIAGVVCILVIHRYDLRDSIGLLLHQAWENSQEIAERIGRAINTVNNNNGGSYPTPTAPGVPKWGPINP